MKTQKPDVQTDTCPDGWNRFERAVDAAIKSGPKHRVGSSEPRYLAGIGQAIGEMPAGLSESMHLNSIALGQITMKAPD